MGKGGTKFVGEAIGARNGRGGAGGGDSTTSKNMRGNMQKFLESGSHPELEAAAQRERELNARLLPMPEFDISRPFVFLDITIGGLSAGEYGTVSELESNSEFSPHNPSTPQPTNCTCWLARTGTPINCSIIPITVCESSDISYSVSLTPLHLNTRPKA
jgi:hypothetical protein